MKPKSINVAQQKNNAANCVAKAFFVGIDHYGQVKAEKLAEELITLAKQPEYLTLISILHAKSLHKENFRRLLAKFPILAEAHSIILEILSSKRETGGLKNELNAFLVNKSMPIYDEDWRKVTEWAEKIKNQDQMQALMGAITIIDSARENLTKKDDDVST